MKSPARFFPLVMGSLLAAGILLAAPVFSQQPGENEPNLLVPENSGYYQAGVMPDRIVATPAQNPARGFAVNWRTQQGVDAPLLEIVKAGDSPDVGVPRQISALTRTLGSGAQAANYHRADIDGLEPDTLYMFRVAGAGTWSGWRQLRTLAESREKPLTLLYLGDTQNKNLSHVSRVMREAMRHAPDAALALHAGDLVSGAVNDNEWGEWFEAMGDMPAVMMLAPAIGNHEYWKAFENTPQERRVLGGHWRHLFALPGNGAAHEHARDTTYWFDANGVRMVVLDGTSALDLGSMAAQAQWLDKVLADSRQPWNMVMIHQPMFSPRGRGDSDKLRQALLPILEKHGVDLVLQGHDHTYGRRSGEKPGQTLPQYIVSVAGAKQYRITDEARRSMRPVAEDTQLFQVIRIVNDRLHYQARTATGRLYDSFEILRSADGRKRLNEITQGRIAERDCHHREATLAGRKDRCWE